MNVENETVEQVCGFFHNRLYKMLGLWNPFLDYAYEYGDDDELVVYIRKTFDEFKERVIAANRREILVEINLANSHILSLQDKIDELEKKYARREE